MKIKISFETEEDRIKGITTLINHIEFGFDGIGKNLFIIRQEQLEILNNENIKYSIVKVS